MQKQQRPAAGRGGAKAPKKRHTSTFAKGMFIYIGVLALVIIGVLFALWQILENYEKTTPRAALDAYFNNLSNGSYQDILKESGFEADEVNTEEDYIALLHNIFGEAPDPAGLEYRQVETPVEGGQVYAIFQNSERLGDVTLHKSEKSKYGWTVKASYDYLSPYTITAPGHVQVLMNGLPLDPAAGVQTPVETFADHPDPAQIPYTITYTTEPTLAIPEFTAQSLSGGPSEIVTDPSTHTVTAGAVLGDEAIAEYTALTEEVSKVYANFVTEDAAFAALDQYLYPGTPLRQRMAEFYAGWYVDHQSFAFRDMAVSNIVSTSDTTFTSDITFVYEIYQGDILHEFPTSYHLSFAQYEGGWRLLDLQVK